MPHTELRGSLEGLDYRLHLPAYNAAGAGLTGSPAADRASRAGSTGGAVRPPLIVMLHGCLQDAELFSAATRMLEHARDAVILYPEQAASANPQRCWNWFNPDNQRRDAGEAGRIASLTRHIAAEHGVDEHRIYVVGISAGGMMAAIVAAAYPDVYAALGVHSAGAFPTATTVAEALSVMRSEQFEDDAATVTAGAALRTMGGLARTMPVVIVHGNDDPVVNVANAQHAARSWWLVHLRAGNTAGDTSTALRETARRRSGTEGGRAFDVVSWRSLDSRATPTDAPVVELWRIDGLAHAWSGGVDGASYADANGPDAALIMLRFLLRHRRP